MGGMAPELGWESLNLLKDVLPELQKLTPLPATE
jgi:hypothetical protein